MYPKQPKEVPQSRMVIGILLVVIVALFGFAWWQANTISELESDRAVLDMRLTYANERADRLSAKIEEIFAAQRAAAADEELVRQKNVQESIRKREAESKALLAQPEAQKQLADMKRVPRGTAQTGIVCATGEYEYFIQRMPDGKAFNVPPVLDALMYLASDGMCVDIDAMKKFNAKP